jgi:hypothetical protein
MKQKMFFSLGANLEDVEADKEMLCTVEDLDEIFVFLVTPNQSPIQNE